MVIIQDPPVKTALRKKRKSYRTPHVICFETCHFLRENGMENAKVSNFVTTPIITFLERRVQIHSLKPTLTVSEKYRFHSLRSSIYKSLNSSSTSKTKDKRGTQDFALSWSASCWHLACRFQTWSSTVDARTERAKSDALRVVDVLFSYDHRRLVHRRQQIYEVPDVTSEVFKIDMNERKIYISGRFSENASRHKLRLDPWLLKLSVKCGLKKAGDHYIHSKC